MQTNRTVRLLSHQPVSVKIATVKSEVSCAVKRAQDYEKRQPSSLVSNKSTKKWLSSVLLDNLCRQYQTPVEHHNLTTHAPQPTS